MKTIPCRHCGAQTVVPDLCDQCYSVEKAVRGNIALARKILDDIDATDELSSIDKMIRWHNRMGVKSFVDAYSSIHSIPPLDDDDDDEPEGETNA